MTKRSKETFEKEFGSVVIFLTAFQDKIRTLVQNLDNQTNILIGFGSALFLFSASMIVGDQNVPFFWSIAVFSAATVISGLTTIHPPKFMRKNELNKGLLFNKRITSFTQFNGYKKEVFKMVNSPKAIVEQCAMEIYSLSNFYYRPKRLLFKLTRGILFIGIIVSVFVLLLTSV